MHVIPEMWDPVERGVGNGEAVGGGGKEEEEEDDGYGKADDNKQRCPPVHLKFLQWIPISSSTILPPPAHCQSYLCGLV